MLWNNGAKRFAVHLLFVFILAKNLASAHAQHSTKQQHKTQSREDSITHGITQQYNQKHYAKFSTIAKRGACMLR